MGQIHVGKLTGTNVRAKNNIELGALDIILDFGFGFDSVLTSSALDIDLVLNWNLAQS